MAEDENQSLQPVDKTDAVRKKIKSKLKALEKLLNNKPTSNNRRELLAAQTKLQLELKNL
jgi:hypothetical protein